MAVSEATPSESQLKNDCLTVGAGLHIFYQILLAAIHVGVLNLMYARLLILDHSHSFRTDLLAICLVKMVLLNLGLVLGGLVFLFLFLRSLYRKKISELSLTAELSKIGISRAENEKIKGTAVICGGR